MTARIVHGIECSCAEGKPCPMATDPGLAAMFAPVRYHIAPTYGPAHVTDGQPCWCSPTMTDDGLCIHRESN